MAVIHKRLCAGSVAFVAIIVIVLFTAWGSSPAEWPPALRFAVAAGTIFFTVYAAAFPFENSRP